MGGWAYRMFPNLYKLVEASQGQLSQNHRIGKTYIVESLVNLIAQVHLRVLLLIGWGEQCAQSEDQSAGNPHNGDKSSGPTPGGEGRGGTYRLYMYFCTIILPMDSGRGTRSARPASASFEVPDCSLLG